MIAVLAKPGRYRLRVAAVDTVATRAPWTRISTSGWSRACLKPATLVPGVQEGGFSGRLVFRRPIPQWPTSRLRCGGSRRPGRGG